MHTYAERVFVDVATGRPLAGRRATVVDAETEAPVQAYRNGEPVTLVSGAHGTVDEFQTESTTRRVRVSIDSRSLSSWALELVGASGQATDEALADAKAYTDSKVAPLASSASVTAGDQKSLADAKSYTDSKVANLDPLPTGGTTGQVLTKTSTGSAWQNSPTGLPSGGSTGQVLTKTSTGEAWADPQGSAYLIVGPGRPDQPSTTAGTITGSEPVGAEYRSTDGGNVGAWVWRKRLGNVWEVSDGDTGWRVVSLTIAPWYSAASVRLRRVARMVYMEPHAPSMYGVWRLGKVDATGMGAQVAFTLDPGFRPANRVVAQILTGSDAADGERLGRMLIDGTNGAVRVKHPANNALSMTAAWPAAQPWPTTLPGTPA
ncbi:hypothetical protein [Micrococcus lylae]|uniref:Phage tail fiber protein n=1 Tax=Micrococcus lylae TaxID=1273 RepID=A0ABY2K2P7_9MICC|nr:hypothetical protein [Micrococcus lylae]TFI01625.1 hypothetical protein E4A49_01000 [Micrococcus lylae]